MATPAAGLVERFLQFRLASRSALGEASARRPFAVITQSMNKFLPNRPLWRAFLAIVFLGIVLPHLRAQDRLKSMPNYERFQRMNKAIPESFKSGAVSVTSTLSAVCPISSWQLSSTRPATLSSTLL